MIILSQRIDYKSEYEDIPFSVYHFPRRYKNQIHPGDRFIYYQGDRLRKERRYYYGCGVIGAVESDTTGANYYAEILVGNKFPKNVPIYHPNGKGFIESIDYKKVRIKSSPSWQNSIRKISDGAYYEILRLANVELDIGKDESLSEKETDAITVLINLNKHFLQFSPTELSTRLQKHIDRGTAITKALKTFLGPKCQICGWIGFAKINGEDFIEAHHIVQLSKKKEGSLCTDNVILVCPNCHREIHYGKDIAISDKGDYFEISLSSKKSIVIKNTLTYLSSRKTK